jgi:ABC-type uncharacterized transport system involved in gliding motility auxiliary subunit
MSPRIYARYMALILFSVFLSVNAIAGVALRGLRLDLTEDHLYTLSPGTRRVINDLVEPIDLTFFYSSTQAARYPSVAAYAARVREMLLSYAGRSGGKIRVHEVEPVRFTESEDEANAAGITPVAPGGGDPLYLGVSGSNAVDERASIAALSPTRERFLEHDLTRLIAQLDAPATLNVAIVSSLPLDLAAARSGEGLAQPLFFTELARAATIELMPQDFTTLPDAASIILVVQPWALSDAQLYAIDQFILRKGRAFIAVDPAAIGWDEGVASPFGPAPVVAQRAELKRLFDRWGVSVSDDVVIDGRNALNVEAADGFGRRIVAPQPLYFKAPASQMSRDDLITAGLTGQVNFAAPGALSWTPTDGVTIAPLISTSGDSMHMAAQTALARPGPQEVSHGFKPSGKQEVLAVRLSGVLQSAFGAAAAGAPAGHLAKSMRPAQIVIVSDADFLNDGFYVGENRTPFADNGALMLNAIDMLSGSDALVSLRSRSLSARPLTLLDDLRARASARLAAVQEKLRAQLNDSESKLEALEKSEQTGGFSGNLGAERTVGERAEIKRFRESVGQTRADLRASERQYRREIDRVQGWVIFINVWLMPILVACAGLFLSWRRAKAAGDA